MNTIINAEHIKDVLIVSFTVSYLDISNVLEFKRETHIVLSESGVILDMTGLDMVDSSGLAAILWLSRRIAAEGGILKLCAMTHSVLALFDLVQMTKVADIYETRQDAIASLPHRKEGRDEVP